MCVNLATARISLLVHRPVLASVYTTDTTIGTQHIENPSGRVSGLHHSSRRRGLGDCGAAGREHIDPQGLAIVAEEGALAVVAGRVSLADDPAHPSSFLI